jgi:two-component system, chemotaxis family, protein-glutamate methylesterase/glutaminase
MKRVLVVDDSSFMRKTLTYLLESDKGIEVVGTAADGAEAVRKVELLRPDVVILDLEMSGMDGFEALAHIMAERPTPVLVLTGVNKPDAKIAVRCREQGAVDFITKPSGVISYDIDKVKAEIIAKVNAASAFDIQNVDASAPARRFSPVTRARTAADGKIVVIGASTGGPRAVGAILLELPASFAAAVLVVQHMSAAVVPQFVAALKKISSLEVALACDDEAFSVGRVVVSPGGCHTLVIRIGGVGRVGFSHRPSEHAVFPSVDIAMSSAASAYGEGALGVLLTGAGTDGARGMKRIKDAGGATLAEDPATCLASGMTQAAIDLGCIDQVVPLYRVAQTILEMI